MPDQQDPIRLIISAGAIVALLATVVLSVLSLRDYSAAGRLSSIAACQGNAQGHELARCRTITPEQLASDQACGRVWAEHRQRLLGLNHDTGKASTTNVPTPPSQPSELPPENNNRLDAGHSITRVPRRD